MTVVVLVHAKDFYDVNNELHQLSKIHWSETSNSKENMNVKREYVQKCDETNAFELWTKKWRRKTKYYEAYPMAIFRSDLLRNK